MYSFHNLSRPPSDVDPSTHHALLKEYMKEVTLDICLIYISHDIMRCSRHICRIQNEGPDLFGKK